MGLAEWFARRNGIDALVESSEQRLMSISDPAFSVMLGYGDASGSPVSANAAMGLSAVYRAASLVAGSIGSLPLTSYERADVRGSQRRTVPSFLDSPGGDRFTPVEWKELVTLWALLQGTCYLQHIYTRGGAITALYPVPTQMVTPHWDDARPGGKRFEVREQAPDGTERTRTFDPSTMTQIMGPSLDGLAGLSVITLARLSLGAGLAGDRAANRMMSSGMMLAGLVTPETDGDLDEDEAKAVKAAINRDVLGPQHAGDIAVMNKALRFTPWSLSAADAQFIQSRTFQIDEVGRWFGVPPHLLGLTEKSTSWGQGIAEQNRGLARYTLAPWTGRIEGRLSRLLYSPNRFCEFDYAGFTRPSPEDEIGLLIEQVNSGLLTLNEARAIRNMPPVPGGDVPRTPAGAAPPTTPAGPADDDAPEVSE